MIPWRRKRRLLLLVLSAVTLMVTCLEFFNVFGPVRGGPARSRSPFDVLEIEEDRREYFVSVQGGVSADGSTVTLTCLDEGVDWNITVTMGNTRCVCKHGWYGNACSIPSIVQYSDYPANLPPTPRLPVTSSSSVDGGTSFILPRRIINAFPMNVEFEMLEIRLHELGDIVDVFLILESNYTAYGDPKSLRLRDELASGKHAKYASKIVYVLLDYFPAEGRTNGWIIMDLLREHLVIQGLLNQTRGYRDDDVLLLTDADELPRRELVMFLKLHDNYSVPVGYQTQWTLYGFFWGVPLECSLIAAVPIAFLRDVLQWKASPIRSWTMYFGSHTNLLSVVDEFSKTTGTPVGLWKAGRYGGELAGWHCSWCCDVECIRDKLVSAINGDFPRWGDYPEKRNITYLRHLVKHGLWFDDVSKQIPRSLSSFSVSTDTISSSFAPSSVLRHEDRFKHLIFNPYV